MVTTPPNDGGTAGDPRKGTPRMESGSERPEVRAKRLRRIAKRRGLDIRRARTRDPRDIEYERWMIIDPHRNAVVAGTDLDGRPNMTLDEVEAWLMNQVPIRWPGLGAP
jgi:hypothetical protein